LEGRFASFGVRIMVGVLLVLLEAEDEAVVVLEGEEWAGVVLVLADVEADGLDEDSAGREGTNQFLTLVLH
jgi:hypothetical protein